MARRNNDMLTPRELHPEDAEQLFAIDHRATPYPWTLQHFFNGLQRDEFGWGLESDGQLAAFALFNQVLDESTLLNVAVDPPFQRRGLAAHLLSFAISALRERGAIRCLLEVRASNLGAIALYQKMGFALDGYRRNYYPTLDGREDALLMSMLLHTQ